MSSITNSIYDVVGAFDIAELPDFLGPGRKWNPVNSRQESFLPLLKLVMPYVGNLKQDGLLDAKISWIAEEINKWFRERGFSIELTDLRRSDVFYMGSIYEQLVHWLNPGSNTSIRGKNGRNYPDAVRMDDNVSFFHSDIVPGEIIAAIETKDPRDFAYMVMLNQPSSEPFSLLQLAKQIDSSKRLARGYTELSFPKVHIDHQTDMSWLKDLWTVRDQGERVWIMEAKQQSILKVNEKGALAKSAFGMSMMIETALPEYKPLIIDSPFLFWISREGYPLPLFAAWVDYSEWKDPGNLS